MNFTSVLKQQAYINGQWSASNDGSVIPVIDPASGETLGMVPDMGGDETETAIAAAKAAAPKWAALTAAERAAILRRLFNLMMEKQDLLAHLLTREQGKPITEARGEIAYGASYVEWYAEEGKRAYGEVIPAHAADKRIVCIRQPIGVVGAIVAWNFPFALTARKLAPALAAGCTLVLRPASQTPFSALAIAALAHDAGVPPGVFNVVTGSSRAIGAVLTSSRVVRKLTFTGSTEVGRELMRQSSDTIKKLSLELGGNAPFLVFDDADVDAAIQGAMIAKFRNNGQTCVCANRFYVQDGVYDEFVAKLAMRVAMMKPGNGLTAGVDVGPLIDEAAVAKVEEHVTDALAKGAKLMAGGGRGALGGTYFVPTVLSDVTADMKIAMEETFGPVAGIIRFKTEEEAIERANDSEFGLASYFYSRDLSRVWRVAEALEAGMVGINTGLISTALAPFGGVKQSGLGREGSRHGLDDYMETKYLCMGV
jgi:succinate-semialdehyde dehydrogenase/glutarate-semialdehyde dehydrogenase